MISSIPNGLKNYLSLVKFSHTIFAMPFALIGFFLSIGYFDGNFSWKLFSLIILCMVFARNAAMSFNRFTDHSIDKRNPRTALREIPSGIILPRNAMVFSIINSLLFIIVTFFINKLVFFLSPVALLVILGYSFTKRFTYLCHFILGLGLSLAPIGAFLAVTGEWNIVPIIYSIIVLFWVTGFDITYAIQDEDFDKDESLKSIPAVFGGVRAKIISALLHVVVIVLVVLVGFIIKTGILYWIGATGFVVLLVAQHIIVKPNDNSKINFAFASLNGIASIFYALFNILSFYF